MGLPDPATRRDAVEMDDHEVVGPLAVHLDDGIGQELDRSRPGGSRLGVLVQLGSGTAGKCRG
jgi:hypothetical protein